MKIGVLATGWNCSEYFDKVLEPWLKYKENHDIIISAVCGHFSDAAPAIDNTRDLMLAAFDDKKIDYVAFPVGDFDEAAIRNTALSSLLANEVDYVILLDFDEIYTIEQIENIFKFVEQNPFTIWFKIHFKNYVFDEKHYVDDFCPPRIFKAENLSEFYYDNDANYFSDGAKISYKNFASMEIPRGLAFINHYSWCGSPERLKAKVDYQLKHFNGICSYGWNPILNQIFLDLDFYKKYNVPIPTIYEE